MQSVAKLSLSHHYIRVFLINVFSSVHWAWMDVKCRYRRSVIGPLWETINVFVMIVGMSYISGAIFGAEVSDILPYLGLGLIVWSLIVNISLDGTTCFILSKDLIKNSNMGIGVHVGRTVFRLFINAAHHILIYFVGLIFLDIDFGWEASLALLGFLILFINALWVIPFLGLICARFRDVEMVIKNFIQLMFFVTPIFWNAEVISSNRKFIVDFNPFYYFIESIRAPLLGKVPDAFVYMVLFGITVFGYSLLAFIYTKMRRNLAFYV